MPCALACVTGEPTPQRSVTDEWARSSTAVRQEPLTGGNLNLVSNSKGGSHDPDEPIARVDGQPIARREVLDLLIRGHGVGILEQLIVHHAARRAANEKGLTVGPDDLATERDIGLARLVGVAAPSDMTAQKRREAEVLLAEVLARQNISVREFELGLERNALLRKIVTHEMRYSDADVQAEFERAHGERISIRNLQARSAQDASELARQLAAGTPFAELAQRYASDRASAEAGGLLPTFSRHDRDVPEVLRETAFKLEVGAVSYPIRVRHEGASPTDPLAAQEWFHIIRVEQRIGPAAQDWRAMRPELERRLSARLVEPAMQELHRALFLRAKIDVVDPTLREEFERKHNADRQAASE